MSDLRSKVIRLAHARPDLRPALLPLLSTEKVASRSNPASPAAIKLTNAISGMFKRSEPVRDALLLYALHLASLTNCDTLESLNKGMVNAYEIRSGDLIDIIYQWKMKPVVSQWATWYLPELPRLDLHKGLPFISLACMDKSIKKLVEKLSKLPGWEFDDLHMENFDELLGDELNDGPDFDWEELKKGYDFARQVCTDSSF